MQRFTSVIVLLLGRVGSENSARAAERFGYDRRQGQSAIDYERAMHWAAIFSSRSVMVAMCSRAKVSSKAADQTGNVITHPAFKYGDGFVLH